MLFWSVLGASVASALLPLINPAIGEKYGIEMTTFILENVSVPPEVEQAIDKLSTPWGEQAYTLAYRYQPRDAGVSWTYVEGTLRDLAGAYTLEPAADGATRVTYRLEVDLGVPLPGLVRRQAAKQVVRTALSDLKRRVESM